MTNYKNRLEKYEGAKTRFICPSCKDKRKTFSRYINVETGEQIAEIVGRCNRVDECGYHLTPREYFTDHPYIKNNLNTKYKTHKTTERQIKSSSIEPNLLKASLKGYESNNLILFLIKLFGNKITSQLISKYFIGSSKQWPGATVFWQVDTSGIIRGGKIMLYDPEFGKRVKKPFNHITWVHVVQNLTEYKLNQCFFGEHLLKDNSNPVAIVESEKTAIIASVYFPQFIWLAVGGKEGLNVEKCQILKGRKVVLFPDLGCFDKWDKIAKELSHIADFLVSDLLEKNASVEERQGGFDLADYLIKYNYETFALLEKDKSDKPTVENCQDQIKKDPPKNEEPVRTKYKTIGDIFDYYYNRGYKSLPPNVSINFPGWS